MNSKGSSTNDTMALRGEVNNFVMIVYKSLSKKNITMGQKMYKITYVTSLMDDP